jgi:hypothetical protein
MRIVSRPRSTNKIILFLVALAAALLAVWVFWSLEADVRILLGHRMGTNPAPSIDTIVGAVKLLLLGILGYLLVRALNSLFFGMAFRLKTHRRADADPEHLYHRRVLGLFSDRLHLSVP